MRSVCNMEVSYAHLGHHSGQYSTTSMLFLGWLQAIWHLSRDQLANDNLHLWWKLQLRKCPSSFLWMTNTPKRFLQISGRDSFTLQKQIMKSSRKMGKGIESGPFEDCAGKEMKPLLKSQKLEDSSSREATKDLPSCFALFDEEPNDTVLDQPASRRFYRSVSNESHQRSFLSALASIDRNRSSRSSVEWANKSSHQ